MSWGWLITVLAAVGACTAHADRLLLNNGRALDGLVVAESNDTVTLRVSGGEMHVQRHRIKTIQYSSPSEASALEAQWKRQNYLRAQYVPEGLEPLARRMRNLRNQRYSAITAKQNLDALNGRRAKLQQELETLRDAMLKAGAALRALDAKAETKRYNDAVIDLNETRLALTRTQEALERLPEQERNWNTRIDRYSRRLENFRRDVAGQHRDGVGEQSRDAYDFVERVLDEVSKLTAEFRTSTTSLTHDHTGYTVEVMINREHKGRFVVDTGAAVVTVSEAFAHELGLDMEAYQDSVELVLANGESVTGTPVLLDHVAVGGISSRDVPAVVLAQPPSEGIDGLLGMTFLHRFHVSLDPAEKRLTFKQFEPGE